jgi:hypothetical protein
MKRITKIERRPENSERKETKKEISNSDLTCLRKIKLKNIEVKSNKR